MNYIYSRVSSEKKFFGNTDPFQLSEKYGTPLYVYNENILRKRCRDLKGLISYPNFTVNYSLKANSNLELIKIVRSEGLTCRCHVARRNISEYDWQGINRKKYYISAIM